MNPNKLPKLLKPFFSKNQKHVYLFIVNVIKEPKLKYNEIMIEKNYADQLIKRF